MSLSERGLTDDKLNHLLANVPERSVILLEDIDAAFAGRTVTGEQGYVASRSACCVVPSQLLFSSSFSFHCQYRFRTNVTFSGLLNALDGVASASSQRIVFMTTNHIDRLDPALIRPGRVDLQERLGDATPYQASELLRRFYTADDSTSQKNADELEDLCEQLVHKVREGADSGHSVSMASLQGHFIRNPSARDAVKDWDELVRQTRLDRREKMVIPSAPS
jgi:mitochondrial chaperone BCS1